MLIGTHRFEYLTYIILVVVSHLSSSSPFSGKNLDLSTTTTLIIVVILLLAIIPLQMIVCTNTISTDVIIATTIAGYCVVYSRS